MLINASRMAGLVKSQLELLLFSSDYSPYLSPRISRKEVCYVC